LIYDHFSSFENWSIRVFSLLTQMFLFNLSKFINESCSESSNLSKYQFLNNLNLIWLIYDHFSHFKNWSIRVFSLLTQMFFLNLWKFINKSCSKSSNLPKYQFLNNLNLIWLIYDHFSHFENWSIRVFSLLTQMFLLNLWKFINKSCSKSSNLPKYQFLNDLNLIWLIYDHFSSFENWSIRVFSLLTQMFLLNL